MAMDTQQNTGYRWRDKDPILDLVNSLIDESGHSRKWIADQSGISVGTLRNWHRGKTKKPQAVTVKYVLDAIGFSLAVKEHRGSRMLLVPLNPRTGRPMGEGR